MSKQDKTAYGDKFVGKEPTRVESLSIKLKFDAEKYLPVADKIAEISGWGPLYTLAGDTINFNYRLEAAYFGEVEMRLNQVIALLTHMDSGIVIEVDSNMLDDASCLLIRTADSLRKVKAIIDARKPPWEVRLWSWLVATMPRVFRCWSRRLRERTR